MTRHVLMPIPQRDGRIGALQPEGILLLRKRDAKHHVVHLSNPGIAGQETVPIHVHEGVFGGDAHGAQHGLHVVGKSLAVPEAGLLHLAGRVGLVTTDTELDAHIAGLIPEIVIQDPDLPEVGTGRGRHVLQSADEISRKVFRPFLEPVAPGSHVFPCPLASGDADKDKIDGRGHHEGDNLPPGRHHGLVGIAFENGKVPLVRIGFPGFLPHLARFLRQDADRRTGGDLQGIGGLFHLDLLAGDREEGREGSEALPERQRILVGDGERVGGCGLVAVDEPVLGEAGSNGYLHQVFLLDFHRIATVFLHGAPEGSDAAELVRVFLENRILQAGIVEDADTAAHIQRAGGGRRHRKGFHVFQDDGIVFLLGGQEFGPQEQCGSQTVSHCFFRTMVLFSTPMAVSQNRRRSAYSSGRTSILPRLAR